MDQDDEDVSQKRIVDKYAALPESLSDVCLANFAVWYVPIYKESATTDIDNDTESIKRRSTENKSSEIVLSGGCGVMKKAHSQAVLRYHRKSLQKAPTEYYYSQLLLNIPWRNEEELLHLHSYQDYFNANQEIINHNKAQFEHYTEIIESTLDEFETNGAPVHGFEDIAP